MKNKTLVSKKIKANKQECPFCSKSITNTVRALKIHLDNHIVEIEDIIQFSENELDRVKNYYRKYI